MQLIGYIGLLRSMDNINKNFEKEANKYLKRVGKKFLRKVKLKTPVDTGYLRRSWRTRMGKDLSITISTTTKYAPYVENGHRTKSGKHIEGRYMLKKTVEEAEKDLDDEFEILIKNLWG